MSLKAATSSAAVHINVTKSLVSIHIAVTYTISSTETQYASSQNVYNRGSRSCHAVAAVINLSPDGVHIYILLQRAKLQFVV